jgi:hypothetical protein
VATKESVRGMMRQLHMGETNKFGILNGKKRLFVGSTSVSVG